MKRITLSLALAFFASLTVFAQTGTESDGASIRSMLVFNSTLESLVNSSENQGQSSKYHVLRLSIQSVRILSAETEPFRAEALCIEARWLDRNTLVSRQAILRIEGQEFREKVAVSASDQSGTISPNRPALILAQHQGFRRVKDVEVPVLYLVDVKGD